MPSKKFYKVYTFDSSDNLVSLGFEQYRERQGLAFSADYNLAIATAASTAGTVLITTPTAGSGLYTICIEASSDKGGTFTFSENPSATATGGSTITGVNIDRTSSNADTLAIVGNGTYTTSGTILQTVLTGSTGFPSVKTRRYKLAASTNYLIRFVATSNTTNFAANLYYFRES